MRIDSSTIEMESARTYSKNVARRVSSSIVAYTVSGLESSMFLTSSDGRTAKGEGGENALNLEDITAHFKNTSGTARVTSDRSEKNASRTIRQQCMEFLMELLFRFRGVRIDDVYGGQNYLTPETTGDSSQLQRVSIISESTYLAEEEHTAYATTGTVVTADGREISFNLQFSMSRSFAAYYEQTYATAVKEYCDPLVINLDTNVAQVSDQKFFFDLDCDGVEDEISSLGAGSGFLALDVNGDGVINDGSELFGTQSGNGFADLAQYDVDHNGWIDEADPIWNQLLIWTKDENGQDQLYHLSDLGVGAIGLTNVATQFALNDSVDNTNNAMIRYTGVFLYENGDVSTVQHVDLAR